MKAFRTMLKVELKLSIRDMNMVIFALAMPLIITIILGFVYGNKPAFDGANYTSFDLSFGAMASIGILASGLMGLPLVLSINVTLKCRKLSTGNVGFPTFYSNIYNKSLLVTVNH